MAKRNLSHQKPTGYLEQILGSNRGKKSLLYDFDFTIGRSKNAFICSQDPNVSRNHCSLKYSPTGWTIKDLGSVNGTFVDDNQIPTDSYVPLTDGSSIFFGASQEAPEGYRFKSLKSATEDSVESEQLRRSTRCKTPSPQKSEAVKVTKRKASPHTHSSSNVNNRNIVRTVSATSSTKHNIVSSSSDVCVEDGHHSDSSISSLDSLTTRIRKTESAQKKQKRAKLSNIDENMCVPSTSSDKQHLQLPASLDRISFLGVNSDDEDSQSLINKDALNDWNVESNIDRKSNLNTKSPAKDFEDSNDLDSKSVAVHSNLLKVLQKKVNDLQKTLKTLNFKFSETLDENAKLGEILKSKEKAEMDIKEDFKKLMEDELICNICTELFIKPVTLGCSHTFCQYCIFEWKRKKKQCPMCRKKVEIETQVLFLDNFINKAVEQLDPASLEKRNELMKKREEMQKMQKKRKGKKGKSQNRRRSASNNVPEPSRDDEDEVELLRSRISDIQSYTDDIQAYVDVIDDLINDRYEDDDDPDYYYGGHGLCHNCGRSGHWANRCPF